MAWIVVRYVTVPVGELRGALVYHPYGSVGPRVAGLAVDANVGLADVPETLLVALLFSEDKKFFQHHGFDFEEIANSLRDYVARRRALRGASTLTQQLARTIFLTPARTLGRKLSEALYTAKLERYFSKDELLVLYVNNVEWGRGIFGVRSAAAHYLEKQPSEVSRVESAFLVAILPNPVALAAGLKEGRLRRRTAMRMRRLLAELDRIDRGVADQASDGRDDLVARLVAGVRRVRQDAQQTRRPTP